MAPKSRQKNDAEEAAHDKNVGIWKMEKLKKGADATPPQTNLKHLWKKGSLRKDDNNTEQVINLSSGVWAALVETRHKLLGLALFQNVWSVFRIGATHVHTHVLGVICCFPMSNQNLIL